MDKREKTQGPLRVPASPSFFLLFLSFLLWPLALVHASTPPVGCPTDVRAILSDLLNSPISRRLALPGSDKYGTSLESYFSRQENLLQPAVIVQPTTPEEVSLTLKILLKNQKEGKGACFAVRGGGKGPWEGAANIGGGVTIDLTAFNETKISDNRVAVKVGAGLKWADVYKVTDEAKLSIPGGRDGTVGVAGLTLGGGMSYFGPQTGFVCDSVIAYEIILADGRHVLARPDQDEDLFRALKGGSNNFGIVLSFMFKTTPFEGIWGGQKIYTGDTVPQHLDAIYEFTNDPNPDPHATVIQSFAFAEGSLIAQEGLKYTQAKENPPAFDKFLKIEPVVQDTNRVTNMSDVTLEQGAFNVNGRRQALMSTTFVNDREMLQFAFEQFNASWDKVKPVPKVAWSLTFQPLPPSITQQAYKNGSYGNVLGLEEAKPLILCLISISWDKVEDDEMLTDTAMDILDKIDIEAQGKNLNHRFKYLDYAWPGQKVIPGYGMENKEFMENVSRTYDPDGLFQKSLPGGFKLFTRDE